MAKEKQIAHGTSVLNDTTTLTLIGSIDPPPRKREMIDGRDMQDDFDVPLLGIEERSEFALEQYWHPNSEEDEELDAAFEDKTELTIKLVSPHASPVTDSIPCKVVSLEPQQLVPNGVYKRKVGFVRTGDITRTGGDESGSESGS
jgi:hypothetical protein